VSMPSRCLCSTCRRDQPASPPPRRCDTAPYSSSLSALPQHSGISR
jgi:hypothetical protein